MPEFDSVVVGAGPNGLTAGALLARSGRRVLVLEAADRPGGACRTDEAFGAGIRRDRCASVHPTGFVSPAFADLALVRHGVEWVVPELAVVHGFSAGDALAVPDLPLELRRDWLRLLGRAAVDRQVVLDVLRLPRPPDDLWGFLSFGARAGLPAGLLTRLLVRDARLATVFAGIAAHAARPPGAPGSAAAGLVLAGLAEQGWPVARGGSQAIVDALVSVLVSHGGEIATDCRITDFAELPDAAEVFFDVSPRALCGILGDRLPAGYRRALERFRYGPGTCKVDFLLTEPIPWRSRDYARTATFHLARDVADIAATERAVARGVHAREPWVLGGEPTHADPARAPSGTHLAWAYCHVPNGSGRDVSEQIIDRIESCAPGFRDVIAGRIVTTAAQLEAGNATLVGGDIGCGSTTLRQLLARPVVSRTPQATPLPGIYLCSAATAPGGGVHGMSGYRAAQHALAR